MEQIRLLRKRANLTQAELAERLSVGRTSVATWEANNSIYPQAKMLPAIATALNSTIDELFGGTAKREHTETIVVDLKQSCKRPVTFSLELTIDYENSHSVCACEVYEAFLPKMQKLIAENEIV